MSGLWGIWGDESDEGEAEVVGEADAVESVIAEYTSVDE